MPLNGYFDRLSHDRIVGWAHDDGLTGTPVGLVVSVNGRVVARCMADAFRADLEAMGIAGGYASFDLALPSPLSTLRAHEVSVRREGDGTHLIGSPKVLAARCAFDPPTRVGIEDLVTTMAADEVAPALAFMAGLTEQLRDRLAEQHHRVRDRRHRRGLGWQDSERTGSSSIPRALVIDDGMPSVARDAGSNAILSHMQALRRLGFAVTFVPATLAGDPGALEADGFATCLRPWYSCVEDVLRRQSDAFQLVYLHRLTNAGRYIGLVRQHQPCARVVYSVADLHFLRSARQAQVQVRPELLQVSERQREEEIAAARQSDVVITHSTFEALILAAHVPANKVHVVPWAIPVRPTAVPFSQRRGVAFVAHYAHQPNADAARTMLDRVMPAVWRKDPTFPCLMAGSSMPTWLRCLANAPAEVLGAVPDLAPVFDRVRLTAAPLAFGAGIKGKVLSSLAAGIPCACSSVAAEGLDLPAPLTELVADDPDAMAAVMHRLNEDEGFNARCATAGLEYVATRLCEPAIDRLLQVVLSG